MKTETRRIGISYMAIPGLKDVSLLKAEKIIEFVSGKTGVAVGLIKSKSRQGEYLQPRQICAYLIHKYTTLPLKMIGELLGGRDHSTIIASKSRLSDLMETETKTKALVEGIEAVVKEHNF